MLTGRKIGIRFAALAAFIGMSFALSPAFAQSNDAMEQYRISSATATSKSIGSNSRDKKENKDRGVVVYIMRGWLDVFSTGMDDLADKMKRRGINAIALSHSDHLALADEIVARHKRGIKEKLVIIGHSLGANACISVAEILNKAGINVPLIITYDPTVEKSVPPNVTRLVNFYQSNNGWGVRVDRARGFKGKLENIDLAKEELGHTGIDKSPRLHALSISWVNSLGGGRRDADPDDQPMPRPRPRAPETVDSKSTSPFLSGDHKEEKKDENTHAAKHEPKAESKSEEKTESKPVTASAPSSGDTKTPTAPVSGAAKPAADKPEGDSSGGSNQPGLFSDVKRPTL